MSKSRGVLIAGNWKMTLGCEETRKFFADLRAQWSGVLSDSTRARLKSGSLKLWVHPPALSLSAAIESSKGLEVGIGSQNIHWETKGAFTGEVSAPMLREIGVTRTLVGHSERRQFFGETDATAKGRTEAALAAGFEVILCVGESRAERESGQTEAVLDTQLKGSLPETVPPNLIIAYEPVWAIGTGLTATPEQAEEAHKFIRKWIWDHRGMDVSARTQLLYGGSVKPDNIVSLLKCPNIDGALIGGASLNPVDVLKMTESAGLLINQ